MALGSADWFVGGPLGLAAPVVFTVTDVFCSHWLRVAFVPRSTEVPAAILAVVLLVGAA